jgi:hypothetical protein
MSGITRSSGYTDFEGENFVRSMVQGRRKLLWSIAGLVTAGTAVPSAIAGQDGDGTPVRKEKKLSAGEKEAKKLLLLMDKDQNGKVSKEEFMGFMEAEFDRLDKDKNGELDVQELTQSRVRSSGAIHR